MHLSDNRGIGAAIILTLMKGDEVVELRKTASNNLLFSQTRNQNRFTHKIIGNQLVHHGSAFRGFHEDGSHRLFARNVVFPEGVTLLNDGPQTRKTRRHKPVTCVVENKASIGVHFVGMPLEGDISDSNDLIVA